MDNKQTTTLNLLDLYDRRIKVLRTTQKIIDSIVKNSNVSKDDFEEFESTFYQHEFIFQKRLSLQLRDLHLKISTALSAQTLKSKTHPKKIQFKAKEITWFISNWRSPSRRFDKYLRITWTTDES